MLLAGVDIPFPEAQINIHQPTIKEIGLIGEQSFFNGCGVLNFSKDNLEEQDRVLLKDVNDFEILMSLLMEKGDIHLQRNRVSALMVLSLLFPEYEIKLNLNYIELKKEDEVHLINSSNFEEFKKILRIMFSLEGRNGEDENYNPGGDKAREIAEKLKKRKQILAQKNENQGDISILGRFASILAIGQRISLNEVLNYTVYQIYDQFDRFELKENYDIHLKAQLAGAKDLQNVDHWMKDLHEK
jgi:hypothetical protein